jgi:GH18 family chitinase
LQRIVGYYEGWSGARPCNQYYPKFIIPGIYTVNLVPVHDLSRARSSRSSKQHGVTPTLDKEAGVQIITWDTNQGIAYDDKETLQLKAGFALSLGLVALMVWAVSQDTLENQRFSEAFRQRAANRNGRTKVTVQDNGWRLVGI